VPQVASRLWQRPSRRPNISERAAPSRPSHYSHAPAKHRKHCGVRVALAARKERAARPSPVATTGITPMRVSRVGGSVLRSRDSISIGLRVDSGSMASAPNDHRRVLCRSHLSQRASCGTSTNGSHAYDVPLASKLTTAWPRHDLTVSPMRNAGSCSLSPGKMK